MKRIFISLIFFALIIFISKCKKDTTPTGPNADEPIAIAQIGPAGGRLETEDFILEIPPGSFNSNETLTLTEPTDEDPFSEERVTKQFSVEGLPDDYTKPLKMILKYNGSLSDESFILIGEEGMNAGDGQSEIIYDFIPAQDSSGYLLCDLPLNPEDTTIAKINIINKVPSEKKRILIKAVSSYFSHVAKEPEKYLYKIYMPSSNASLKPEIVEYFDKAFIIFLEGMLLNFPGYVPSIYIANLSGDEYCKFAYRNARGNKKAKGIFAINSNKLNDLEKMQVMISREVLRFILFGYDPQYPVMVNPSQQTHYWLKQALVTWSEPMFTVGYKQIPTDFIGNESAPFNGMHAGIRAGNLDAVANAKNHGSGMASIFEYFFGQYFRGDIGAMGYLCDQILIKIKNGMHPVKSIEKTLYAIDPLLIFFWEDFLDYYVFNLDHQSIFDVKADTFLNMITNENTFNINSSADTLKEFNRSYSDLSGKLFRINVNDTKIRENGRLKFKLDISNIDTNLVKLEVVGRWVNLFNPLGRGFDFTVENLKNYNTIVALVINNNCSPSYTGTSNINLEVRVEEKDEIQFNHCKIKLMVTGGQDTSITYWNPWWYTVGNFTENVYTGTINTALQGGGATGTTTITIDDDFNITSLSVMAYSNYEGWISEWGFTAENIPPTRKDNYGVEYIYSGDITCSFVKSIHAKSIDLDGTIWENNYFGCDDNCLLEIYFH
jgi:hypothetical protein